MHTVSGESRQPAVLEGKQPERQAVCQREPLAREVSINCLFAVL